MSFLAISKPLNKFPMRYVPTIFNISTYYFDKFNFQCVANSFEQIGTYSVIPNCIATYYTYLKVSSSNNWKTANFYADWRLQSRLPSTRHSYISR